MLADNLKRRLSQARMRKSKYIHGFFVNELMLEFFFLSFKPSLTSDFDVSYRWFIPNINNYLSEYLIVT